MARVWRSERVGNFALYGASERAGVRIVRTVTQQEGERRVERGEARRVYEEVSGKHIGYQLISTAEQRGDRDLPSLPSAAAISVREMRANAGELGQSRTVRLHEDDRESRRDPRNGHLLPPEDFIERTRAKIAVYAGLGSRRGDIVRAWKAAEAAGLL